MRAIVLTLTVLFLLSACERVRVVGEGGSKSKPKWGVQIGF